jgi:hypothetical protein
MDHAALSQKILNLRPRNSREQDLLLAIKGQYPQGECGPVVERIRRVVAVHNGVPLDHMSLKDAAYVLLSDLYPLLKRELDHEHRFIQFMMELAPRPQGDDYANDADRHFAALIERVATRLLTAQVRDAQGNSLLPFPIPEPDAAIAEVLAAA